MPLLHHSGQDPCLNHNDKILCKNVSDGKIITSNNDGASIGWRNQEENSWKIYLNDEIIYPNDNFEIIIFKMGFEPLIKKYQL